MNDADKLATIQRIDVMLFEAHCQLQGMIAENKQREHRGESLAYVEADFHNTERCHTTYEP